MAPAGSAMPYGFASDGPTVETIHGQLIGTPVYMSPEQARGEPATAPSDMYAFGLLLQELYTGQRPYPSDVTLPALLDRIGKGESLPPIGVSRDVADLILRLKSLAPTRRPTAVDAADSLRRIREKPKRQLQYAAAALLAAALAGGGLKYTIDLNMDDGDTGTRDANRRRGQAEEPIGFCSAFRAKLQRGPTGCAGRCR
jgi:serine/threonine protein kinase